MRYKINLSNTTVTREGSIEIVTDNIKCSCVNVATCFNIDCEDCIFDGDNNYYPSEIIHRMKLK